MPHPSCVKRQGASIGGDIIKEAEGAPSKDVPPPFPEPAMEYKSRWPPLWAHPNQIMACSLEFISWSPHTTEDFFNSVPDHHCDSFPGDLWSNSVVKAETVRRLPSPLAWEFSAYLNEQELVSFPLDLDPRMSLNPQTKGMDASQPVDAGEAS